MELKEIRKKARLGIKKDRIQFFQDIAKEAKIAKESNQNQRRRCGSEKCRC